MALDLSDTTLAEKLRREDPEQFHTLVRMHLSFVLDLNTDDCQADSSTSSSHSIQTHQPCPGSILHVLTSMWKDACYCVQAFRFGPPHHTHDLHFICYDCAVEKSKYRPSKWTFVPFSKKPKCLSKGVMEGAPLTQEGICQVYQLIEYLSKESNNCQEGIFRRSGKLTRQQELKTLLNQGMGLNLDSGYFSVHDCASVLKNFLAELPEPLLTDGHYPVYCQIAELCGAVTSTPHLSMNSSEIRLLHSLQLLLLLLPTENRVLLRDVLQLLHLTASQESSNKMSADSLSTLFTPHLLCPRKLTPEAFHANSQTMSGVVAFMIRQGLELFEIPPKLATDIRAYWLEREKRKQTERELNESVCDGTAANTVFSFVDRELTAQAHSSNSTEAALAQLYAHIQSLPESSKKKKLIRQFNKGNGQGTPVQLCRGQKHHLRSKSLGDSIKKHIFNKSLKRQKNINRSGHFAALRSLSQEMMTSPQTPVSKMKLFQSSLEEESHSSKLLDNLPDLRKSLFDSNTALVHLRYSRRASRSSVASRLVFSDSENSYHEEGSRSIRKDILQNLADQVVKKEYIPSPKFLKRHAVTVQDHSDSSSSSKEVSTAVVGEMCPPPSTPHTPHYAKPSYRHQGTDIWPVSTNVPAFICCSHSDGSPALPGFFSPPLPFGSTNNNRLLTTPRNIRPNCLMTSTPASHSLLWASANGRAPNDSKRTSLNHSSCLLTPIADENNSMSPITRSTQKMPKAMQETMMTPRSRKPVVVLSGSNICHLANLSTFGKPASGIGQNPPVEDNARHTSQMNMKGELERHAMFGVNDENNESSGHVMTTGSCGCNQLSYTENAGANMFDGQEGSHLLQTNGCCDSGDSLTSTFKSYLMSRSVLTASPVDLSFSSRTGDFDTSSFTENRILTSEALSESLLYCLDGNEPSPCGKSSKDERNETDYMEIPTTSNSNSTNTCFVSESMSASVDENALGYRKGIVHETSL